MEKRRKGDKRWNKDPSLKNWTSNMVPNPSRPSSRLNRFGALTDPDWLNLGVTRALSKSSGTIDSANGGYSFRKRRQSHVNIEEILTKHQVDRPRSVSLVKYEPLPAISSESSAKSNPEIRRSVGNGSEGPEESGPLVEREYQRLPGSGGVISPIKEHETEYLVQEEQCVRHLEHHQHRPQRHLENTHSPEHHHHQPKHHHLEHRSDHPSERYREHQHRPEHHPEHRPDHHPEHTPEHRQEHRREHHPEHRPEHTPEHRPEHHPEYHLEHRQEHHPEHHLEHRQEHLHPEPMADHSNLFEDPRDSDGFSSCDDRGYEASSSSDTHMDVEELLPPEAQESDGGSSTPKLIRSRTFEVIKTNLENLPVIDDSSSISEIEYSRSEEDSIFDNEDSLEFKPKLDVNVNIDGVPLSAFLTRIDDECPSSPHSLVTYPGSPKNPAVLDLESFSENPDNASSDYYKHESSSDLEHYPVNFNPLENLIAVNLPNSICTSVKISLQNTLQEFLNSLQNLEIEEKRLQIVDSVEDRHLLEPLCKLRINKNTSVHLVPSS